MNRLAVVFDANGTLVESERSLPQVAASCFAAHVDVPLSQIWQAMTMIGGRGEWPDDTPDRTARLSRWSAFFRAVVEELGHQAMPDACDRAAAYVQDPSVFRLLPGAAQLLRDLADHPLVVGIGLVSNFDAWLRDVLVELDIHDCFAYIGISAETTLVKPDPRSLLAACDHLAVEPANCLYVGDSVRLDVGVAKAAGAVPVLLDRTGATRPADFIVVDQLSSVLRIVQELGAQ